MTTDVLEGKVMIEVRCNEYTMRDRNPHVPWSAAEKVKLAGSVAPVSAVVSFICTVPLKPVTT